MEENIVVAQPEKPKRSKKKTIFIVLACVLGFYSIIFLLAIGLSINDSINEIIETNANNYDIIFDIADEYKKVKYKEMDTFNEYTYNSALLFVPREKPDNLLDFYYEAYKTSKRIKCRFYFAYKLDHDSFETKKNEIYNYTITIDGQSHELIKNDTDFYYPAVIISYNFDQGAEFILFDCDNDVIIHVFDHYNNYYSLQRFANYNISSKTDSISLIYPYLVAEGAPLTNEKGYLFNKYGCFKKERNVSTYGYSFYAFSKNDDYQYYNDYEYAK